MMSSMEQDKLLEVNFFVFSLIFSQTGQRPHKELLKSTKSIIKK